MNEMITWLCIGMLSCSIISLFGSLLGTITAYKKHIRAKKKIEKEKKDQEIKMEEILNTQKEIIRLIDNMKNSDKDVAIEVLEKAKKELQENYHSING